MAGVTRIDDHKLRLTARLALLHTFRPTNPFRWTLTLMHRAAPPRGKRAVFVARHRKLRSPIVLKVYDNRHSAGNVHRFLEQTAKLTRSSARPLFVLPRLGVVGMEYLGETTLSNELQNGDRDRGVRLAADWLARFHADCAAGTGRFGDVLRGDPLDVRLGLTPSARQNPELRPVLERLDLRTGAVADETCDLAHLQVDCKPDNLMMTDRGLVAIDRSRARIGPVEEDIANLLVILALHYFTRTEKEALRRASTDLLLRYGISDDRLRRLDLAIDRKILAMWIENWPVRDRVPGKWTKLTRWQKRIEAGKPAFRAL